MYMNKLFPVQTGRSKFVKTIRVANLDNLELGTNSFTENIKVGKIKIEDDKRQ